MARSAGFATYTLAGYEGTSAAVRSLDRSFQGRVVRRSLRAGMKVVASRARALAPRRSRRLAGGDWKVRAARRRRNRVAIQVLSPTRGSLQLKPTDAYYAAAVELGHLVGRRVQGPLDPSMKKRAAQRALQSSRRRVAGRWTFRQALVGYPTMVLDAAAREAVVAMRDLGEAARKGDAGGDVE